MRQQECSSSKNYDKAVEVAANTANAMKVEILDLIQKWANLIRPNGKFKG